MTELTRLQKAVIEQLGYDELDSDCASTLKDLASYGIDGGFTGFIYYSETCQFFDDNKQLIMEQLLDDRCSIGYNSITEMLASFKCFKGLDTWNIERFLINTEDEDNEDQTTLKNGLAWYAGETVAWQLEEEIENILNNEEEIEEEEGEDTHFCPYTNDTIYCNGVCSQCHGSKEEQE